MEAEISEDFAALPGVGIALEGQDWVFVEDDAAGVVSPVFETESAFYILELLDESPAGTLTLEEVSDEIRADLVRRKKTDITLEEARGWRAEIESGSATLEGLAERLGVEVRTAGPVTRQDFIPGLGQSSPAIGAAFGTPVGQIAGPVPTLDQVALIHVDERVEADRDAWQAQSAAQRTQLTAEIQQTRLDQWLEGLRTTTTIIDDRDAYFEAAEQQAEQGPQIPMFF